MLRIGSHRRDESTGGTREGSSSLECCQPARCCSGALRNPDRKPADGSFGGACCWRYESCRRLTRNLWIMSSCPETQIVSVEWWRKLLAASQQTCGADAPCRWSFLSSFGLITIPGHERTAALAHRPEGFVRGSRRDQLIIVPWSL